MTLLEIILSLALLGGTMAVIGEKARISFQNAHHARDLAQAELLAESILAKVQLGIIEMTPVFDIPVGSDPMDIVRDTHAAPSMSSENWLYSLEVSTIDDYGYLAELAVTVRQNVLDNRRPVVCRLVRWLAIEPVVEEDPNAIQ